MDIACYILYIVIGFEHESLDHDSLFFDFYRPKTCAFTYSRRHSLTGHLHTLWATTIEHEAQHEKRASC